MVRQMVIFEIFVRYFVVHVQFTTKFLLRNSAFSAPVSIPFSYKPFDLSPSKASTIIKSPAPVRIIISGLFACIFPPLVSALPGACLPSLRIIHRYGK